MLDNAAALSFPHLPYPPPPASLGYTKALSFLPPTFNMVRSFKDSPIDSALWLRAISWTSVSFPKVPNKKHYANSTALLPSTQKKQKRPPIGSHWSIASPSLHFCMAVFA